MKFSLRSMFLIAVVSLVAFCIMSVKKTISTETDENLAKSDVPDVIISDSTDNLMWFVQITDLHISIFQDKERITELREFCDLTLKTINPPVVLVSGDLTDAKLQDTMGSEQLVEEWSIYADILDKCGILKTTTWLDIRGNHDNFNVPGVHTPQNLYRKYSVMGSLHDKSYIYVNKFGKQYYSFIGVDGCPDQGLKRPFNFVGYLSTDEMSLIKSLDLAASQASNYTVWFGHYPTSCMVNSPRLREMIGSRTGSLAYLCGHYHSLLDWVPRMYTIQKEHYLELELTDWKDNRMFRVAAIDHGVFSFIDLKHREWPIILVTNPKNAKFRLRFKEPNSLLHSTHVRILVFSPNRVTSVKIQIDGGDWENCFMHKKNKQLFLKEWDAQKYAKGFHNLKVKAVDELGREKIIDQPFAFDESHVDFELLPRLVLMLGITYVLQVFFWCAVLVCVVPLVVLRALGRWRCESLHCLTAGYFRNWVRRLWLLSNSGWLFWLFVIYPLYLAFGPWSLGEVINGHLGMVFIWGTFVNNQFIPELSTYGHGFFYLVLFHFPLLLFTAYALDQRRLALEPNRLHKASSIINWWLCNASFFTIFGCQLYMTYTFWMIYGMASVAVGPVRTLPLAMTLASWYYSKTFPLQKMKVSIDVWEKIQEEARKL